MPLDRPIYQLTLPLEGVEDAVQDDLHLSSEEVRARSEAALSALAALRIRDPETGKDIQPRWMDLYKRLQEGGWIWRVAVYIAWAAQPKKYRWPESQELLATMCLGLTSDRAISTWRKKNPAIDNTVGMLQGAIIYDALPDIYDAMIEVASTADYKGRGDRELAYKLAGILSDKLEVTQPGGLDLSQLAFEELLRMAGVSDPEALIALRERLKTSAQPITQSEETSDEENEENEPGI